MAGSGPEFAVPYELVAADGSRAVFNDDTDPDYVGVLTAISGFDSPEIRESYDDIVEHDGGLNGPFFYGRRPMTLEGVLYGHASATVRNTRISKLKRATNAMREDAILTWTPEGSPEMYASVRRQQPLRIDGGWVKTFQVPLVAADPRFYATTTSEEEVESAEIGGDEGFSFSVTYPIPFGVVSAEGGLIATNAGDAETFPVYTVFGPGENPIVTNTTTDCVVSLIYDLPAGQAIVIDTYARTVEVGYVDESGEVMADTLVNRYGAVDFTETIWGGLTAGDNLVRVTWLTSGPGSKLRVNWKSAWL